MQHLAEVGRCGGVHETGVPLHLHRLDHAQRGEWIDEARRPLRRFGSIGQGEAQHRRHASVLRVRRTSDHRHGASQQCLSVVGRARCHHHPSALVPDRHGLTAAAGQAAQRLRRDVSSHDGVVGGTRRGEGVEVGGRQQQAEVRRVDGCGLDADKDLVRLRLWHLDRGDRELQLPIGCHEGTNLSHGGREFVGHGGWLAIHRSIASTG